jgi:uncharacterized protein
MSATSESIKQLNLIKHPEGGYYRETYRSPLTVGKNSLPDVFSGARSICTAIFFLLPSNERSLFHRIKSDELWHFHSGCSLSIYIIHDNQFLVQKLGPNHNDGESFQLIIPAMSWFGALCNEEDSHTLSTCTVSPGFDFADFELAERSHLLAIFPEYREIIVRLTKPD